MGMRLRRLEKKLNDDINKDINNILKSDVPDLIDKPI